MSQKIVVNGKEYASIDELPADERRVYEAAMQMLGDNDGDGIPDVWQRGPASGDVAVTTSQTQIVVDGRVYRDAAELPPEARARYEAAMRQLDADGNGIPDLLEGAGLAAGRGRSASPIAGPPIARADTPIASGGVRFESTGGRFWLGLVVVLVVLAGVLAVVFGPSLLAR